MATLTFDAQWVTIANRALLRIGSEQISSLDDGSSGANFCTQLLPQALDACYGIYPWRSALKRQQLAPLASVPSYGFAYQFSLPSDFARLRNVECNSVDWQLEGSLILTDSSSVSISYSAIPSSPANMTPSMRDLVVKQLAYLISIPMLKNDTISSRLLQEYTQALSLELGQNTVAQFQEDTIPTWYDENR